MNHNKYKLGSIASTYNQKLESFNIKSVSYIMFHPDTTQFEEIIDLIKRVTLLADRIEYHHIGKDSDEEMGTFKEDIID